MDSRIQFAAMINEEHPKIPQIIAAVAMVAAFGLTGCAVVSTAATGVSLGAKAASTTVGVAGSAAHATGAAAGAVVGGDDDKAENGGER